MFELAARLVGVYKVNHMVSVTPTCFYAEAVANGSIDEECYDREQRLYFWAGVDGVDRYVHACWSWVETAFRLFQSYRHFRWVGSD